MSETIGLLVMAYGTPSHPDEIEPYYTHIRGGRRPTPELLAELEGRYRAIGGRSPLNEITRAQAEGLAAALNARGGRQFSAYLGMKHWHPYIGETVARMAADGIRRAVGLPLTPLYSSMSVGTYIGAVEKALGALGDPPQFSFVKCWHLHPQFVAALSDRVREALDRLPAGEQQTAAVVFTAHSLPEAITDKGDPYPQQLRETAAAVAERLGLGHWTLAYQSAGRTPAPWLGPDIKAVMAELHAAGHSACVICPAGFVSDHLEILYDLDVECAELAGQLGLRLERTASFNAGAPFLAVLSAVAADHLAAVERP